MSFLLTLTKKAKNRRIKRNFIKNIFRAALSRAGYCLGHGLGLHLLPRQFHLPSFPGNVTGRVQRCNADTQNFCCFFSRNKFFHKAYFLQSVKFVIVFVQNHMNTLAAETTSAWYLILNRKRQTLPIYISQLSSHLPRPLTMGTQ